MKAVTFMRLCEDDVSWYIYICRSLAQAKCLRTGGPRSTAVVLLRHPPRFFLRKGFSLNCGLIYQLGWLAGRLQAASCLHLLNAGLQMCNGIPDLRDAGNLNSLFLLTQQTFHQWGQLSSPWDRMVVASHGLGPWMRRRKPRGAPAVTPLCSLSRCHVTSRLPHIPVTACPSLSPHQQAVSSSLEPRQTRPSLSCLGQVLPFTQYSFMEISCHSSGQISPWLPSMLTLPSWTPESLKLYSTGLLPAWPLLIMMPSSLLHTWPLSFL